MFETTLSLNELLRLAFDDPVNWLNGDPTTHPPLNWVVVSIDDAQQGDLVVVSSDDDLASLIQQAVEIEVAAVLVCGQMPDDVKLPVSSLPVAALVELSNIQMIQRDLLTVMINQNAALIERGILIHDQLSQLVAEGDSLAELVGAIADFSGRGVIVQDKRLGVLAEHPPKDIKSGWDDILQQVILIDSLPETMRDRKLAASQNKILELDLDKNYSRLVTSINAAGMARGYLSLVAKKGTLDALDRLITEKASIACAVDMARAKAVHEAEKRLKGDLLNALLQEELSPRDAELWVQGMDIDPERAHAALRFAWWGSPSPSRRRLETIINGEVSRQGLRVIISPVGAEIICFCEGEVGDNHPETAFKLGQAVIDLGAREYPDTPILCGIGTLANDLSEWRTSFRQAGQALELARRFGERKWLYFPDLSVYRLLIQIEHSPELIAFQEEILGNLLANEGGRELIRTLESYFQHNGNLSQTAETLYIHRNTLIYRMDRIATITGLNLDDPETRLAIQLALHIYRMMGNMRN